MNDENKTKGFGGADIGWVEEAEEVEKETIDKMITLRDEMHRTHHVKYADRLHECIMELQEASPKPIVGINVAKDKYLDAWGHMYDLERNDEESDADFRKRILQEHVQKEKVMTDESDFKENTRVIIDGERVDVDGSVTQAFAPKLKKIDPSTPSLGLTEIKKAVQFSFFLPADLIKKQLEENPHGIDCVIEYVTQEDGYPRGEGDDDEYI